MNTLRTGVFLLFGLLVPVSCSEPFFNDLVICYFLDAFLMVYCITVTGFFFRAKFANLPAEDVKMPDTNGIYQELERPVDADPYQVLEPSKRKKKAKKKRKTETTQPAAIEMDVFESMVSTSSTAPSRRPPQ